jgi:hypothetical protein
VSIHKIGSQFSLISTKVLIGIFTELYNLIIHLSELIKNYQNTIKGEQSRRKFPDKYQDLL